MGCNEDTDIAEIHCLAQLVPKGFARPDIVRIPMRYPSENKSVNDILELRSVLERVTDEDCHAAQLRTWVPVACILEAYQTIIT